MYYVTRLWAINNLKHCEHWWAPLYARALALEEAQVYHYISNTHMDATFVYVIAIVADRLAFKAISAGPPPQKKKYRQGPLYTHYGFKKNIGILTLVSVL